MSELAHRIVQFMTRVPPEAQLFRRRELDKLGPSAAVDRCLDALAREGRVGSPGPDLWFPLHRVPTPAGPLPLPPTHLRHLAENLLRREGVALCLSPQERDYRRSKATFGREGVWGVPNFEDIGVTVPVPLQLEWGGSQTQTVYGEERLMPAQDPVASATDIHDAVGFRRRAERLLVLPERLEKDIRVNSALALLGRSELPPHGLLLFAGGTSLTKAWQLAPRFSEDVDLRFQGQEAYDRIPPEPIKREVHGFLRQVLAERWAPQLPGGRLLEQRSDYERIAPVQRIWIEYDSLYQADKEQLKFEIMFTPGQVPWEMRTVQAYPVRPPRGQPAALTTLPSVVPWTTMTGKLHALANMVPGEDVADMRHVVDLGAWLLRGGTAPFHPYMVNQALREYTLKDLLDGLWENLDRLAAHPDCESLYQSYVGDMLPGGREGDVPAVTVALAHIEQLWRDMCRCDWENVDYLPLIPPTPRHREELVPTEERGTGAPPPMDVDPDRLKDDPFKGYW